MHRGECFIDGSWISRTPNGFHDSLNPATGGIVGRAPRGSEALATQAIEAARAAFETTGWASTPRARAAVLLAFADRLETRRQDIAQLLTLETGKLLAQASHEVAAAISEARYYAGLARNIFGRTFESGPGRMSLLTREAAGVVSIIVPWNAPVTLLVRSLAPALAAGCACVVKPANETPLTNAAVIACLDGLDDLPPGVVNSVNECGTEVGRVLSSHREIDVVSFTGSSRTGKLIMENAARTTKHVSLELGGKAPAIVFADADLDQAVSEIRRASLTLNGQMCTAISRVLVQNSIRDAVIARLKSAYLSVRIGDPMDPETELGPLIDRANQARIMDIVERASAEHEVVVQGRVPAHFAHAGAFVAPSIHAVEDVRNWFVQEEHFGPILSVEYFSEESEAVDKANATRFGLAASVYSADMRRAMRVSRKLKFGTVWLNCHNRLMAEAETGGWRESGIGRLHGIEALNDFLQTKHVYYETVG